MQELNTRLFSCKAKEGTKELTRVQYLPPMTLHFQYVESYPSNTGPAFLLTCQWLSEKQLAKLCQHMDQIWRDCKPEVVLFRWMSFLQEEALQFLEIGDVLDISPLKNYISLPIEIDFSPPLQKEKQGMFKKQLQILVFI